jgi:hypothetical protein
MSRKIRLILSTIILCWTLGVQGQEILNYTDRPGQSFTSYVLNKGDIMAIGGWDQLGRTTQRHWENATFGNRSALDLRFGFGKGFEGTAAFKNSTLEEDGLRFHNSVDLGARFQVLEGYEGVNRISLITFLRWYTVRELWSPERPKLYLGFASLTPLGEQFNLTTNLAAHWLAFNETYTLYYNLNFTYQTSPKMIIYFEHNGAWNNNLNGAQFQSYLNMGLNWNMIRGLAVDFRIGYGFSGDIRDYFYGPGVSWSNVDR